MASRCGATVSLCMIVRNEAHQLAECLAPVAHLFDEVVIVDTGSRDATREVAGQFTTRVFEFAWCDDFSAARNEALRHARGDWIFWLDADDRLSPDNVVKLQDLLAGLTLQPCALVLPTAVQLGPAARERSRLTAHVRLFPRHSGIAWRGRVHEQLSPSPQSLGIPTAACDIRIDHLGYADGALLQRKLRRNLRLLRMDYAVNPDDPATLLHLGHTLAQLGQLAEARQHLWRVLEREVEPSPLARSALTTVCEIEAAAGNHDNVIALTTRGLVLFPSDVYLAYLQAEGLLQLCELAAAQTVLESIRRQPQVCDASTVATPSDLVERLVPLALGEVLRAQGALMAAEQVLQPVTRSFPDDPNALYFLGRVYVGQANEAGLGDVLHRLAPLPGGEIFASLLLATRHLARGELATAEAVIDRLIAQAPHLPQARQMRAEILERCGAPTAELLQAYRDLARTQPGNAAAADRVRRLEAQAAAAGPPPAPAPVPLTSAAWTTSVVCGVGLA